MCSVSTFVGLVVMLCIPRAVVGDLPVHCVQPTSLGVWRFHVGSYGGDAQCGYTSPDDPDGHHDLTPPIRDPSKKEKGEYWLSDKFKEAFTLDVVFRDWSTEVLSIGEGKDKAHKDLQESKKTLPVGQWTLVYDEGFHAAMKGASGIEHSFFAFYKYVLGKGAESHSTDNFGNAQHSICDMTLLGWYKQIEPTAGVLQKQECFWAEKISTLEEAISNGQIPAPVALPLPAPTGNSKALPRASDSSPPSQPLPGAPTAGGLPPTDANQGDNVAFRGKETKKGAGATNVHNIVRIILQVALGISVLVAATGMLMGKYYKDEDERSLSSNCWRWAVLLSLVAATIIFGYLWTHGMARPAVTDAQTSTPQSVPQKKPMSIKQWAAQMHEEVQAAKQNGKPVRWTSDPDKLKAWLEERREKFGIPITEDSEVQELLDVVSPPLATGLPGFHSESVIFAQRETAIAEQTQLAVSLGKPVHQMTTEDLHAANWTSPITNHHQIRTYTFNGKALKLDDWQTLKNFDWRQVSLDMGNGKIITDFVNDVPDQGGCGSCYAVSATSMVTSRLMIKYPELHEKFASKKGADRLSVNQQLQCNPYNQGCAGGYPYLIAKWSFENGMKTDSCFAATMKNVHGGSDDKCPTTWNGQGCEDSFRVYTWRYVGGSLGRCGLHHLCEAAIREELYKGGPLTVSIEPSGFGYSEGVLHATPGLDDKSLLYEAHTEKDVADCKDAECYIWRKVDHSVLLVGWGEDTSKGLSCQARFPKIVETDPAKNPVQTCESLKNEHECGQKSACVWQGFPFWTIQNSYGKGFGQGGYLSFGPRGQDVMRVETMVVSADVEWIGRDKAQPTGTAADTLHHSIRHEVHDHKKQAGHHHAGVKKHEVF